VQPAAVGRRLDALGLPTLLPRRTDQQSGARADIQQRAAGARVFQPVQQKLKTGSPGRFQRQVAVPVVGFVIKIRPLVNLRNRPEEFQTAARASPDVKGSIPAGNVQRQDVPEFRASAHIAVRESPGGYAHGGLAGVTDALPPASNRLGCKRVNKGISSVIVVHQPVAA
jgi:hypothetical protein